MTLETHYSIPPSIMLQVVDDETLLYNTQNGQFFAINEVGSVMWEVMNDYTSLQNAADELITLFEISQEQIINDLLLFAQMLSEQGLIVVSEQSDID